jgi:EmrB/QacA subfamily drug resistance transporter
MLLQVWSAPCLRRAELTISNPHYRLTSERLAWFSPATARCYRSGEAVTTSIDVTPTLLSTSRGRLVLVLLCAVAFLDFVDGTIVNIALPAIRDDLEFSLQELQWVPSGYLLTYGGFMLLGGRMADYLGRRRVLLTGLTIFGLASLVGGLANSAELLVASRMVQGVGAAMSLPAALSILTTTFTQRSDRHTALGVWGAVAGLASAVGVLLGGVLTDFAGWRWVMFINPIFVLMLVGPVLTLLPADRPATVRRSFDVLGTFLVTSGMLLLVYTLVEAPDRGWGDQATWAGLAGAALLIASFVVVETRVEDPLVPLAVLRVPGLAAANVVQLAAFAGFMSMFFFLTVYMQDVLGYGPVKTGVAYLPVCVAAGISAGAASQLIVRIGTRPLVVAGSLITAAGIFLLSQIPEDGTYVSDLLPGMVILSLGIGIVFVPVAAAANAGVDAGRAGLAAALLNASQQVGAAFGLAVLAAVSTALTQDRLATGASLDAAMTDGFGRGLMVASGFLLLAALLGLRTVNTKDPEPIA